MKKLVSAVAVGAVAVLACGAMVACGGDEEKTGEAYGMVHTAGYVGKASITVKGSEVLDAALSEICLPTYVTAPDTVSDADKVTVEVMSHGSPVEKTYYKTVSYGDVTFTYDATAKDYKTSGKTMVEFFQTEANAKAYYEAVVAGNVAVKLNNADDKTVMTKAALSKEENGYGAPNAAFPLGWKVNRDKTVEYVKAHGVKDILTLAKASDVKDGKLTEKGNYLDANKVDTGATWTDMNTDKENTFSYAQLFVKAAKAADFVTDLNLVGTYSYENTHAAGSFYGQSVIVTVGKDDKIKDVKLLDDPNLTELSAAMGEIWTEADRQNWTDNNKDVINALKGKTVAQVLALNVKVAESGEPEKPTEPLSVENGQTLDKAYIVTGATQCSGRVVLAVQNALALLK